MSKAPGLILSIMLLMCLFISGPLYDSFYTIDSSIDNSVNTLTNNFQREVRKNGYIDLKQYDNFLRELSITNKNFDVELIHSVRKVCPKGSNDYEVMYIDYGTSDILKKITSNGQKYKLNYGDDFYIAVKEKNVDNSKLVINALYGSNVDDVNSKMIFARYGGAVGNEE